MVHRYENALEKANYAQLAKAQEAQAAADQAANEDDEQVRPAAFAPLDSASQPVKHVYYRFPSTNNQASMLLLITVM